MLLSLLVSNLLAQELSQVQKNQKVDVRNHMNIRAGFSTATTNGRPTICLEGVIISTFAIETCGTGYGFIHQDSGIDFVHFRGKWSIFQRSFAGTQLMAQIGAGFAEIQLADDQLGFQFTGAGEGIETAGPEMSTSIQFVRELAPKTNLIIDMNGGAAYFRYGPNLMVPQSQFFPFFEISAGFGW
ncbi:MAG: hypothetical protein CL916_00845 [Deltaproteobacteria bacterium]|nr:hypothetical protein [Deltaproteobacteria bacterium]